jgi:hypothetical protein
MWYPIIREGQWAVRPGHQQGQAKKVPLKVVAGKSKNQRRRSVSKTCRRLRRPGDPARHRSELAQQHDAGEQGFIKGMKIVDGTVKDKKTKKTVAVKVLMGGYDITEPDVKGKMERGTIANRSAGILYDYVNTETGKTYPAVIEHVALTNKPWITGMVSFGRKLSEGGIRPSG